MNPALQVFKKSSAKSVRRSLTKDYKDQDSLDDEEPEALKNLSSDHSSDELDEDSFTGPKKDFSPLPNNPKTNDFVIVEFSTEPKIYFVGKITSEIDDAKDFSISYLRKRQKSDTFFFPDVPDEASVCLSDIKVILDPPIKCGTTSRQQNAIKFSYNFSNLSTKWVVPIFPLSCPTLPRFFFLG